MPKRSLDEERIRAQQRFTPEEAASLWFDPHDFVNLAEHGVLSWFPEGIRSKPLSPEELEAERSHPTVPTAWEAWQHFARREALEKVAHNDRSEASQSVYQAIVDAIADGELIQGKSGKIKGSELAAWANTFFGEIPQFLERFWSNESMAVSPSNSYIGSIQRLMQDTFDEFWVPWMRGGERPDEDEGIQWLVHIGERDYGMKLSKLKARSIWAAAKPPAASEPGRPPKKHEEHQ